MSLPQSTADQVDNHLRTIRMAKGLSQGALAQMAGVTRQAVCAIEASHYLPTTAVALRLAQALGCQVEDLFRLAAPGELIEGSWLGSEDDAREPNAPLRVKVARVGKRVTVRPVSDLGDELAFAVPADGLLMPVTAATRRRAPHRQVQVQLLRERQAIEREIVVAGCDPAVFLLGDYLRRRLDRASVVGWTMGSSAAVEALKRGEVHIAGLHIVDPKSGESNLPFLRRHFGAKEVQVVTFARWQQGFVVRPRNPKHIHGPEDLARKNVSIVNREAGAGARLLLEQQLSAAGVKPDRIRGYRQIVPSHLEVARVVAQGQADAGISVEAAARIYGLTFVPIREERYDLVIPRELLHEHRSLSVFLDTLVGRAFRREMAALGGYDTHDTGTVIEWQ